MNKLQIIQTELKAPKNQRNNFGKYNYRSCEDILEALKPLLKEHKCYLIITDEIATKGEGEQIRFYVKAVAKLTTDTGEQFTATAFAREELDKKGMDVSQITGSASSYARKYALNGLFAIDDTKDADATNNHEKKGSNFAKKASSSSENKKSISKVSEKKPAERAKETELNKMVFCTFGKDKGIKWAEMPKNKKEWYRNFFTARENKTKDTYKIIELLENLLIEETKGV